MPTDSNIRYMALLIVSVIPHSINIYYTAVIIFLLGRNINMEYRRLHQFRQKAIGGGGCSGNRKRKDVGKRERKRERERDDRDRKERKRVSKKRNRKREKQGREKESKIAARHSFASGFDLVVGHRRSFRLASVSAVSQLRRFRFFVFVPRLAYGLLSGGGGFVLAFGCFSAPYSDRSSKLTIIYFLEVRKMSQKVRYWRCFRVGVRKRTASTRWGKLKGRPSL